MFASTEKRMILRFISICLSATSLSGYEWFWRIFL